MKSFKKAFYKFILIIILISIITSGFSNSEINFKTVQNFSTDIFKSLVLSEKDKNVLISPLSIYLSLAMTLNGAKKETAGEMFQALKLQHLSYQELNSISKSLMNLIKQLGDNVKINIANSIWVRSNYSVLEKFIKDNENNFEALVKSIQIKPGAEKIINKWIEEKTNGKIKNMLSSINKNTVMLLINAIYFLGNWEKQFKKELTRKADFFLENGKKQKVDMMQNADRFPYYETDDFQAVRLNYKGGKIGMLILLPAKGKKLNTIISKLNPDFINSIQDELYSKKGYVYIPKFELKFSYNLNSVLKSIGIKRAFSQNADFSGISEAENFFISLIQHNSFIEVNETGTEAAAATVIAVDRTSNGNRRSPFVFRADRPFLYMIIDNEKNVPLFMGVFNKVTQ